jgi:hypothetical protein
MEALRENTQRVAPEQLIHGLVRKLTHHMRWDAVLIFLPPLAVVLYCLFYLFYTGWISPLSAALLALGTLSLCAVAVAIRYRHKIPSARAAARLIDARAGAQDRFLTLITLEASSAAASLLARLRAEAAGLQSRIALKREFPYKIKRQVYSSLAISLTAAVLFHLLLPLAHSTLHPQSAHERLRDLAQQMAERPNLQAMARSLLNLAAKLEDPRVSSQEKRDGTQEERKKIQEQEKKQVQKQDRELLSQAAGTLEGIEQQSGAGERKKDQEGGAGGIQSNLPQQGQGDGKQSEGSGGDTKGNLKAESNSEMEQGKMAQGEPQRQGKEKSAGDKSGGNDNQPNPNKAGKDQNDNNDRAGKTDGPGADRDGRNKVTEDIPQAAPPAERFNKPGEGGYQGIKGAGYVTVQLPEDLAAEGKGSQSKGAKSGKTAASQVPVSNVPLPKHVPDAPSEKQQMPLEYRGIIR